MLKILVLGSSGQLGQAIENNKGPWNYEFLHRNDINLTDPNQIWVALETRSFDILINAAAYTDVDKAESDTALCRAINTMASEQIALICKNKGAVMIHISTDYVFGSHWNIPLAEDFATNPINEYGKSKWLGEEAIRNNLNEHLIIRTSWLYGLTGKNFPKTMINLAKTRDELKVVFDQIGNPTFTEDLAVAIRSICSSGLNQDEHFGTFHFSNEGVCSWYDFATAILKNNYPHVSIQPVTSEEFPTPAKRPNYSVLNKKKIKNTFDLKIRHWQDALTDFIDKTTL